MAKVLVKVKLTKRSTLSRPLTPDEMDDNWDALDKALQDVVDQTNEGIKNDLTEILPKGTAIIMTDGLIDGGGKLDGTDFWYICDGNTYNTIATPDLRNRMILCADPLNQTPEFVVGDSGGIDQAADHTHEDPDTNPHSVTEEELPVHTHGTVFNGQNLIYSAQNAFVQEAGSDDNSNYMHNGSPPLVSNETALNEDGKFNTHLHTSGGPTSSDGGHDNKPRYYALVFVKYCRQPDE